MKLIGVGVLVYPGTKRIIHNFEDGYFETTNTDLIRYALQNGCTNYQKEEPVKVVRKRKTKV